MTGLRSALWLPIFNDLAEPAVVARLAAEAEQAGWHGVFVWDHLRWREPVRQVADPWITLAAIATATERLRFGPMVTPPCPPPACQGRQGNRDAGPAQRRPSHARRRSRQRPLRRRTARDRRGTR
ncbi:LLM class flavin-dependent oxidoreductase [Kibdelosporangium aridum]|uniref:LLM class flavin-dependent oxidoreductase n=1 Tax=Kibdelosporangium aridum TaxID=2030 RepID=UPI0035E6053C